MLENAHETVRNGHANGHANGQERSGILDAERSGTPRNVRVGTQQRFGTKSGKRSRSRFKNERNTVSTHST